MKAKNFEKNFIKHINKLYEAMCDKDVDWNDPSTIDVYTWNSIAAGDLFSMAVPESPWGEKWQKACFKCAGDEPFDLMLQVLRNADGTHGVVK